MISRIFWTLLGLSPLVLAATGVIMYVIRLQKRRRRSRRGAGRAASGSWIAPEPNRP